MASNTGKKKGTKRKDVDSTSRTSNSKKRKTETETKDDVVSQPAETWTRVIIGSDARSREPNESSYWIPTNSDAGKAMAQQCKDFVAKCALDVSFGDKVDDYARVEEGHVGWTADAIYRMAKLRSPFILNLPKHYVVVPPTTTGQVDLGLVPCSLTKEETWTRDPNYDTPDDDSGSDGEADVGITWNCETLEQALYAFVANKNTNERKKPVASSSSGQNSDNS